LWNFWVPISSGREEVIVDGGADDEDEIWHTAGMMPPKRRKKLSLCIFLFDFVIWQALKKLLLVEWKMCVSKNRLRWMINGLIDFKPRCWGLLK